MNGRLRARPRPPWSCCTSPAILATHKTKPRPVGTDHNHAIDTSGTRLCRIAPTRRPLFFRNAHFSPRFLDHRRTRTEARCSRRRSRSCSVRARETPRPIRPRRDAARLTSLVVDMPGIISGKRTPVNYPLTFPGPHPTASFTQPIPIDPKPPPDRRTPTRQPKRPHVTTRRPLYTDDPPLDFQPKSRIML